MRERHCWQGKAEHVAEQHGHGSPEWAEAFIEPATCMPPHGHDGPHEWTLDNEILVTFVCAGAAEPGKE